MKENRACPSLVVVLFDFSVQHWDASVPHARSSQFYRLSEYGIDNGISLGNEAVFV